MRIVSLIPEATEILRAIGLEDQIIKIPHPPIPSPAHGGGGAGISSPPLHRNGEGAGGWGLLALLPDLIFTSETAAGGGIPRSEVRRAVAGLRPRPGVYALEPHSLGDILSDIKTVGDATGRQVQARALIEALRARIDAVSLSAAAILAEGSPRRIACLQSSDPPITAGWWLAELIGLAGGIDVLDGVRRPPRIVTREQIRAAQPDIVIDLAPDEVVPGPQAVDLLERMVALILHNTAGLRSEIGS